MKGAAVHIKQGLESKTVSHGFALPTVLILSIVLLAIGVSTLQVGASLSRSLIDEHWDRLAKTASQAGVSFASSCLSTGLATWSTQLVPNADCSGAAVSPARSIYISSDTSANASPSRWQSTYTVTIPVTGSDGVPRFRSIGKVELLSATSEIVKTYSWTYDGVLSPPATPTGGVTGAQIGGSGGEGKHSCMVYIDQLVYCTGDTEFGQLGNGTSGSGGADVYTPVKFAASGAASNKTFIQVSTGTYHSCALSVDLLVYCTGQNADGELGDGTTTNRSVPVQFAVGGVAAGKTFTQISTGSFHTCALSSDQDIYCAGDNASGQLGDGTIIDRPDPVKFAVAGAALGKKFTQVSVDGTHTCGLATDQNIYCAGSNLSGKLGDGTTTDRLNPVKFAVGGVALGKLFTQVSAGEFHTCGLATDQKIYCAGENGDGQLGDSSNSDRSNPVKFATAGVASGKLFTQLSSGSINTCAIATDQFVYCTGDNGKGQIGDGTGGSGGADKSDPVLFAPSGVAAGKKMIQVSAGRRFACAIDIDKVTYCTGDNSDGQFGNGTGTDSFLPVISMIFT